MSDMPCIYNMNMLEENGQMEQDILAGRGMDILFCLMDHLETGQEIARRVGIPNCSVQLYLQRMVKANIAREEVILTQNGEREKHYFLVSNEIEIINNLQTASLTEPEKKRRTEISAQHFALMTRNAVKSVNMNADKPHKIKAYFMKAKEEDMEAFKKEIEQLFNKYQALEDLEADKTYSLFTVMAPYEMEE